MTDPAVYARLDALRERIAYLESALAELAAATGVDLTPRPATGDTASDAVDAEIAALLRAGERMKAIKVATGKLALGLREATEYVGRVESSL